MCVKNRLFICVCLLRPLCGLILVGLSSMLLAAPTEKPFIRLAKDTSIGSELQLEARQMPMASVLKAITKKTRVPIHYSVLPEGLVTATCVGSTLQQVLECLLDRKADLIVRYPRNIEKGQGKGQLAEAWVLGSRLNGTVAKADCSVADKANGSLSLNQSQQEAEAQAKQNPSNVLVKVARTKNAEGRAEAIGALLAAGTKGDPQIQEMLESAVHDEDANVRAQALSTLTHWSDNTESVSAALTEAIHDSSADVRLMAIDGITDDVDLLQQAVNDSDEVVRTLAATKLEALTRQDAQ